MRENGQATAPRRRRGPKQALPAANQQRSMNESPYYTIDNTEDIYGTTLSASQRRYVDPWDLENYDYVRKKMNTPNSYYDTSLSSSPQIIDADIDNEDLSPYYGYEGRHVSPTRQPYSDVTLPRRISTTLPRQTRRASHFQQCNNYECCAAMLPKRRPSRFYEDIDTCAECVFPMPDVMHDELDVDVNVYTGYGGFSSASSSTEPHSSIGEDYSTLRRSSQAASNTLVRKTSPPKFDFPGPPSQPPSSYDYCDPYSTLPYCSIPLAPDCYECMSQVHKQQQQQRQQQCSLIYSTGHRDGRHRSVCSGMSPHSLYGTASPIYMHGGGSATIYESTTLGRSRRPSSSLYSGIYTNKFGLSKKGLLQIDYSCSWNDLDRIMGRNY